MTKRDFDAKKYASAVVNNPDFLLAGVPSGLSTSAALAMSETPQATLEAAPALPITESDNTKSLSAFNTMNKGDEQQKSRLSRQLLVIRRPGRPQTIDAPIVKPTVTMVPTMMAVGRARSAYKEPLLILGTILTSSSSSYVVI
jgi:hypothetical protein